MTASNTLSVTDNRTGGSYTIPITRNAIDASEFRQIKTPYGGPDTEADQPEHGLRVFDPGFGNTCVSESRITFV
jgi:citrate synthase